MSKKQKGNRESKKPKGLFAKHKTSFEVPIGKIAELLSDNTK
jgi:hypothetical protein